MKKTYALSYLINIIFLLLSCNVNAQVIKAPDRYRGEGPFPRLIIRGVTIINGNGAPPLGPMDIVVEGNRITLADSVVWNNSGL